MPQDFTNREIEHFFQEIKDSLEGQDKLLEEIKAQVKLTNGRVTKLEFWREGLMAKISGVVASVAVVWVLIKEFLIK